MHQQTRPSLAQIVACHLSMLACSCNNFSGIAIQIQSLHKENSFEIVVCKMAAILFRPQCVQTWTNENVHKGNSKWKYNTLNCCGPCEPLEWLATNTSKSTAVLYPCVQYAIGPPRWSAWLTYLTMMALCWRVSRTKDEPRGPHRMVHILQTTCLMVKTF